MDPLRIKLAAFAAYLPASSLAAIAAGAPGGGVDAAVLVVPFCAAFALAFPAWGVLADRHDRRDVVAAALLLLAAAGVAVALAPGTGTLIGARAVEGLAAAGVPPAAQAALTARSGDHRAGRSLGGMMIAVALATLGGPAAATALDAGGGWAAASLVLTAAVPLAVAALVLAGPRAPVPAAAGVRSTSLRRPSPGVAAGWAVAALVLAGYWTTLTRLGAALGDEALGSPGLIGLIPLATAAGIPLVLVAGRATDRLGPQRPMLVTLAAGAAGYAAAAAAPTAIAFALAAGLALAAYWAYLPVVSVQVQRSVELGARGAAVGGLYASMWLGAAVAGGAAALAGDWRLVLAGAAACWAVAAIIAGLRFERLPGPQPA